MLLHLLLDLSLTCCFSRQGNIYLWDRSLPFSEFCGSVVSIPNIISMTELSAVILIFDDPVLGAASQLVNRY